MHEMSLMLGVLRVLEEEAKRQNFSKVRKLWLQVGELSHADPHAIEFCFEAASNGTFAEGAKVIVKKVAGLAICEECGKEYPLKRRFDECPNCGSNRKVITAGNEMQILKMEVD